MPNPNRTLPPAAILSSSPPRSAVAIALLLATAVAKAMWGFDLMGWFAVIGLGAGEEAVVENLNMFWMAGLGLWAWYERRAPWRRLVLRLG